MQAGGQKTGLFSSVDNLEMGSGREACGMSVWNFVWKVCNLHIDAVKCSLSNLHKSLLPSASRSHEFFWCFSVCIMLRLPAGST